MSLVEQGRSPVVGHHLPQTPATGNICELPGRNPVVQSDRPVVTAPFEGRCWATLVTLQGTSTLNHDVQGAQSGGSEQLCEHVLRLWEVESARDNGHLLSSHFGCAGRTGTTRVTVPGQSRACTSFSALGWGLRASGQTRGT